MLRPNCTEPSPNLIHQALEPPGLAEFAVEQGRGFGLAAVGELVCPASEALWGWVRRCSGASPATASR
jgi:hypothetical protein